MNVCKVGWVESRNINQSPYCTCAGTKPTSNLPTPRAGNKPALRLGKGKLLAPRVRGDGYRPRYAVHTTGSTARRNNCGLTTLIHTTAASLYATPAKAGVQSVAPRQWK